MHNLFGTFRLLGVTLSSDLFPMKLSCLLVATTVAAAAGRRANDDEVAVMNANGGKIGTGLIMSNDLEKQAMEVEQMLITPGLVTIDKMREL